MVSRTNNCWLVTILIPIQLPLRFFRVVDLDNRLVGVVLVAIILWKVDILRDHTSLVNDFFVDPPDTSTIEFVPGSIFKGTKGEHPEI